nr:MAG TPA: hypothetical protein [Caudoviricetes sp.]
MPLLLRGDRPVRGKEKHRLPTSKNVACRH